jgi:hypothetical protein
MTEMILEDLKKPISPIQWRVQSITKNKKAICVPFIDARQVMDRLDEVCGIGGWQSEFISLGNRLFCKIGIKIENEWVWKSDTGIETKKEPEKGEASDALKRAAVSWGIGRFLYAIDPVILGVVEVNGTEYPSDQDGQPIYRNQLSDFINFGKINKPVSEKKKPEGKPLQESVKTHVTLEKYWEIIQKGIDGKKDLQRAFDIEMGKTPFSKLTEEKARLLADKYGLK